MAETTITDLLRGYGTKRGGSVTGKLFRAGLGEVRAEPNARAGHPGNTYAGGTIPDAPVVGRRRHRGGNGRAPRHHAVWRSGLARDYGIAESGRSLRGTCPSARSPDCAMLRGLRR